MPAVTVTLPLPPSANRMYAVAGHHIYKTDRAREYRKQCERRCRAALDAPTTAPVEVTLVVYRPRKAGDLDNYQKVLLDALQGLLYRKDSQIRRIVAQLDDTEPKASRVVVTVEEVL